MSKADGRETGEARRAARLAEQLRANLARRKAQARARRDGAADERPEGLAAAEGPDGAKAAETATPPTGWHAPEDREDGGDLE